MVNKKLICVVGPTAVGKTEVGVRLAQYFNTDVVNADSRQFYKEMSIGTAKPTHFEMDGVHHHFVNFLSIHEDFTVFEYEKKAIALLNELFKQKDVVVLVGGSGLFVNAVCFGLDDIPDVNLVIKDKVQKLFDSQGVEGLRSELTSINKNALIGIDESNPRRLMRALEVLLGTGKIIQEFQTQQSKKREFQSIFIGLNLNRDLLYEKINSRVDLMMEKGLREEVYKLSEFKNLKPLKTVGYQEFYIAKAEGKSENEAISDIKQASRRYAKRQITWFKKAPNITWFKPNDFQEIINYLNKK